MTFFIPRIYEDEILYSFISRYHERSGNIRINSTVEDLFSIPYLKSNIYLPGYINNLVNNFPKNCGYTSKEIILNHTLYPFFTFFDSEEFSEKIFNLMLSSDNNNIRNKSGTTNRKMNPIYFRFCLECIEEDLEKYGETYWHRIHQTPGVLVCPKHNNILYDSSVKINNANIIEYIAPNDTNCVCKHNNIKYSPSIKEKLYDLAQNINFIMNSSFTNKNLEWYRQNYINALKIKGFASINGSLKVENIINEFKNYYTEEFLNIIDCNIDEDTYNNWLLDIFRKPRKRYHPIKHLLIIKFLGYSIEDMINNKIEYNPFGNPSWPCLNKVCDKYMSEVIENIDMAYYKGEDKLVGTFECNYCGFTYTRRGPDVDRKNMFEINKVKDWGNVWKEKLKELAYDDNTTITEMEKILNVDRGTIYRNAKKLGIEIYTRKENNINEINLNNLNKDNRKSEKNYHEIWLNLIINNPDKSKTELRNLDKATYYWLYINDREWLDKVSPKAKKNISSDYNIVDWKKRDNEVLKLIKKSIIIDLNSDNKPEKISINSIARIINKPLVYYLSTNKMPKTKEYVMSLVDDSDSYAKKRIKWAINYIYNHEDEPPTISNIVSISGISQQLKLKYNDYILEVFEGKLSPLNN